jgi:hypothetical protein
MDLFGLVRQICIIPMIFILFSIDSSSYIQIKRNSNSNFFTESEIYFPSRCIQT